MIKNKAKRVISFISPVIIPVLFIMFWEIFAKKIGNNAVLPQVTTVAKHFININEDVIGIGSIPKNILYSLVRVFIGYVLAIIAGLPLGLLMGYSRRVKGALNLFISLFQPVPAIAWRPLVLGWFGVMSIATVFNLDYGPTYAIMDNFKLSMIFLIFLSAFFPIWGNTMFGVSNVQEVLVESAQVLGASKRDIFFHVLLPGAGPNIVNGLKSGLTASWSCLVAAEMLPGSMSGLGYLISHAYELTRMDLIVAGIICIGVIGALFDWIFSRISSKYFSWQRLVR
ncbi:ABC transporter permease [Clostridium sp. Cult3]|uniref:ABC transporter permease n=1 Tax=Clostridium sp. Cult3 TaxID=2079004 RepID=UPI001F2B41E7|nr:ABC transporter permease [Clostridium sp. Cult3]MCF6460654.1 ABC transporter permease [Clostridium sp. Cult3]